ncbi:hypothetical protein MKW92_009116 [Papaver armeniacum]|nr:hypothetical protein MKW92_009116 [Papaver armeniacum]
MAHHHTISGLVGRLVTESEVHCNADKYYKIFKHHEDVPKAVPHLYTSVKVVEGHGITSGCVKEWGYEHDGKELCVKESTTYNDEARTICHSVIEGDLMNVYKRFNGTLMVKVRPIGYGSIVSWTVDYELINKDSPVPFQYVTLFSRVIEGLDSYLCASG